MEEEGEENGGAALDELPTTSVADEVAVYATSVADEVAVYVT